MSLWLVWSFTGYLAAQLEEAPGSSASYLHSGSLEKRQIWQWKCRSVLQYLSGHEIIQSSPPKNNPTLKLQRGGIKLMLCPFTIWCHKLAELLLPLGWWINLRALLTTSPQLMTVNNQECWHARGRGVFLLFSRAWLAPTAAIAPCQAVTEQRTDMWASCGRERLLQSALSNHKFISNWEPMALMSSPYRIATSIQYIQIPLREQKEVF